MLGAFLCFEAVTGFAQSHGWRVAQLPMKQGNYTVSAVGAPIVSSKYTLPDLTPFTYEAIMKMRPASARAGLVTVMPITDALEFSKFNEGSYQPIIRKLQPDRDMPIGIVVQSGIYDLETLTAELQRPELLSRGADGVYQLNVPLAVSAGATLVIEGTQQEKLGLHLSAVHGGLLINAGKLFIIHADVAGWDDKTKDYSYYETKKKFRPFLAAWNGSETYLTRSTFKHMGYAASKSYGITLSTDKTLNKLPVPPPRPRGWIIENHFEGLLYAFYSYEAEDVVVIGNEYAHNIDYGIDPHDRSRRLLFAQNVVHGTKNKHGMIGSREVNDSWFINNHVYDNHGSGIMLDRSCMRNVIYGNIVERNGNDGITIFESPNNIIENNTLRYNGKSGLRVRNAWNVFSVNNSYTLNLGTGMQLYTLDLSSNERRDFTEDPYSIRADLISINDRLFYNHGGDLKFYDFNTATLANLDFSFPYVGQTLKGDLPAFGTRMLTALRREGDGIVIRNTHSGDNLIAGLWKPSALDHTMQDTLPKQASQLPDEKPGAHDLDAEDDPDPDATQAE